jgi:uncharacterized protein YerC
MITNTVQTLVDYVKDISGQTNASNAKIIRALNFGVDHYSYLALTASGDYNWDSRNQADVNRVSVTTADSTLGIEDELITVREVEIYLNDKWQVLNHIDEKDASYNAKKNETNTPNSFDLVGQLIRPLPAPDQAYTYRLTYGRAHPRYSADNLTQATGLIPVTEEYVALYAADKIMLGMSDSARSAVRNELTVKQEEVRDIFSKRNQSRPMRLKASVPNAFMKHSRGRR